MKNFGFDIVKLRIYYYRNKPYLIFVSTIIACLFLIANIIIPQVNDYLKEKEEIGSTEKRVELLNKNLKIISSISDSAQKDQLDVSLKALPIEKDFIGIILAISEASQKTNVNVSDFTFRIGALSSKSAQVSALPTIKLDLSIKGGFNNMKDFITEMSKTLPLSKIPEVSMSKNSASLQVYFYYKPIPPFIINYASALSEMTPEKKSLLSKLGTWSKAKNVVSFSPSIATRSGSPFENNR